jgi:hypothetical protein
MEEPVSCKSQSVIGWHIEVKMDYRGYQLEKKMLMVGWQVTITKDGAFIRNSSVLKAASEAVIEAQAYIDSLMLPPR